MQRIYLDANATTPLDPRVRDAMAPWLDCGNASSPHAEGRAARDAIDRARDQVAALIGAQPREIVFTSGATEANALALLGTVAARRCERVLTSAVEHPSVLRTLEAVRDRIDLVVAPVRADGCLPEDTAVPPGTGLVSVMRTNNETGAILPVKELAARARAAGAVVHTDAVQACGKIPVDVEDLHVDLLTLSAHKMHGPKGAGALYVRRGARIDPLFFGGEHERGLRAGTENVAAIVGLGAAAEYAAAEGDARRELWSRLHDLGVMQLRAQFPNALVHAPEVAVPNTICVTFPDVEGEAVLLALDLEGIAVATGSACSSGAAEPSHVLQAMGLKREEAERSIRISFHAQSCAADVAACVDALARAVKRLRSLHV
ncbi:MAG: cysteine desulfurase family protein [Planctomycetota bacterium]|jgi:cysteine desulfurase